MTFVMAWEVERMDGELDKSLENILYWLIFQLI